MLSPIKIPREASSLSTPLQNLCASAVNPPVPPRISLRLLFIALVLALAVVTPRPLRAAEAPVETLTFHTDWKGESIDLPPRFAPAMTMKGIEVIRFAPGMFDPKAASFFTYALVFSVPKDQDLTPEVIQREMLAYYRGLSEAVSKSKGRTVDAASFTFKLEPSGEARLTPEKIPAAAKVTQYSAGLNWVEPFVTAQPQLLHFEIQVWSDPATARNYLFVCASPRPPADTDEVWKELRQIRRTFEVTTK